MQEKAGRNFGPEAALWHTAANKRRFGGRARRQAFEAGGICRDFWGHWWLEAVWRGRVAGADGWQQVRGAVVYGQARKGRRKNGAEKKHKKNASLFPKRGVFPVKTDVLINNC